MSEPGRRPLLQPALIRLYKLAGVLVLGAILVGLIGFVTINVFFFFNQTWMRPIILSSEHPRVIEASRQMFDARSRGAELETQRAEVRTELSELERLVETNDRFIADVGPLAGRPIRTTDEAVLRRQLDQATIERADAFDRKGSLTQRASELDRRLEEQRRLIDKLSSSAYLRAADETVTVAFVPYANLDNVSVGAPIYGCRWRLFGCSRVGSVVSILEGEVSDIHPHDDSSQRGVMIQIEVRTRSDAEASILFVGRKPLWIF